MKHSKRVNVRFVWKLPKFSPEFLPLDEKKQKKSSEIKNYISCHGVLNINKLGKVRAAFKAKFHINTSLNYNFWPGVKFLNTLISVLLRFREGSFLVIADIGRMFHQIRVSLKDVDTLHFLWRASLQDDMNDYAMLVHIFCEVDSTCCSN